MWTLLSFAVKEMWTLMCRPQDFYIQDISSTFDNNTSLLRVVNMKEISKIIVCLFYLAINILGPKNVDS
jgi:hypothetical protein